MKQELYHYKFIPKGTDKVSGTCCRLSESASYPKEDIEAAIGKSLNCSKNPDTTGEWHFEDDKGRVYTLYDYKNPGTWNIGSKQTVSQDNVYMFDEWLDGQMQIYYEGFGHNIDISQRELKKYIKGLEKYGCKVNVPDSYRLQVVLPKQKKDDALLYVLTELPPASEYVYNKRLNVLEIEWHF